MSTEKVVVPNAVGYDIGCGMCAVKTSLTEITREQIIAILDGSKEHKGGIRSNIPVGLKWHKKDQEWEGFDCPPEIEIVKDNIPKAKKQLGTLGGGNHFIEIQRGSDGYIWIMVHSGSRNLGHTIATHFNNLAQKLCKKWYSNVPPFKGQDGLAFLPIDTEECNDYHLSMIFALDFAYANRKHMIDVIKVEFLKVVDCEFEPEINIHHNFAQMENHFGKNVMVHRKGATQAKKDQLGIIPGSCGTKSYIVKGKGNPNSFESCSHGAGRARSTTQSVNTLNFEEQKKILEDQGIVHSLRHKKDLGEAPDAYKDISVVMENQSDLVDIVVELSPLTYVKG
jgi:tRNA-splicing ligase RtcB